MISIRDYVFAGKATFTVVNRNTQGRMTYRVEQPTPETPHFVKVLTGQDNESSYSFLGSVFGKKEFRHSRKAKVSAEAPSARGAEWFFRHLDSLAQFPHVEVLPSCNCCRCGRLLTTPESLAEGYGPECKQLLAKGR